jgi:hypothetical protein
MMCRLLLHTVPITFDKRGEYVVHVTNMSAERYPIPVGFEFPRNGDVVNREADKFLVSIILMVSGVVLLCGFKCL